MKKNLFFLFAVHLAVNICSAQIYITGKVVDEQQNPLQGASVFLKDQKVIAITDSAGQYSLELDSAVRRLYFSHTGYVQRTIGIKAYQPVIMLYRDNNNLPELVVRSFERNSSIKNIPASVTVLDKATLDRYGNESFVPAINTVPGVKMDERSPGSYRLNIRGNLLRSTFGVRNVKVYWNGIPFTDANGTTYFNEIAFSNVDKVEILKGPSGSMYGAGTGGVILLNSDPGRIRGKDLTVQALGGSYGMFAANASYHQHTGRLNSAISFSHVQSDGYRAQTSMRRDVAQYTGTYAISNRHDLHANIFYSDLYYETPGGLTPAELAADPEQARPAAGAFQGAEAQHAALFLKTFYGGVSNVYRFNEHWTNTTAVYFSGTNFRNPTIRNYEAKTETGTGARSVTQYRKNIFTATIGGEYQYSFTDAGTFGNKLGIKDTVQFMDEIKARQYNFFLQADISIKDDLILNAGLSYNNFHYGFTRLNQTPLNQRSDFEPDLVPRISVLKKIKKIVSIYASASKGFSPPSIDEVRGGNNNFNKTLAAETGVNYEAGIKGNLIKNRIWFDACYYTFRLENTIVSRRDSGGGDFYTNAGKTRQKGFEIFMSYLAVDYKKTFIRQLKLWSGYTNIHARFKDYQQGAAKFDGNMLTGTSPNIVTAGADISTSAGIYANLTYSYTDKIPLNDANTFFARPYNLFFSKFGYRLAVSRNIDADIFASWNKSFNNPYSLGNDLNAAGNRFYNPSAPQYFTAGVKMLFEFK